MTISIKIKVLYSNIYKQTNLNIRFPSPLSWQNKMMNWQCIMYFISHRYSKFRLHNIFHTYVNETRIWYEIMWYSDVMWCNVIWSHEMGQDGKWMSEKRTFHVRNIRTCGFHKNTIKNLKKNVVWTWDPQWFFSLSSRIAFSKLFLFLNTVAVYNAHSYLTSSPWYHQIQKHLNVFSKQDITCLHNEKKSYQRQLVNIGVMIS